MAYIELDYVVEASLTHSLTTWSMTNRGKYDLTYDNLTTYVSTAPSILLLL
jgi:hypothetical protein